MESKVPSTARRALLDILEATRLSACIYAAAKLQIADLLEDGPMSPDALAQMTEKHAPSLCRLLRALTGAGILHEVEQDHFALTSTGTYIQRETPDSRWERRSGQATWEWHRPSIRRGSLRPLSSIGRMRSSAGASDQPHRSRKRRLRSHRAWHGTRRI